MPRITLPRISLKPFLSPSQPHHQSQVAQELKDACRQYGAFYLTDHGIPSQVCHHLLSKQAPHFFNLPRSIKQSISIQQNNGLTRGYIGMGGESGSDAFEVKEAFSYGCSDFDKGQPPRNPLQGPNRWLDASTGIHPEFKDVCESFYSYMVKTAYTLTGALSMSLLQPTSALQSYCQESSTVSLMRLFHYLPTTRAPKSVQEREYIGSSPHTDWGFLTLILQQDHTPGLQIYHQDQKTWFDVEAIPNTLFVNVGDYVSLLTRGEYISPLHRVLPPTESDRMSAVFFYYPDYHAKIPFMSATHQHYSLHQDQSKQKSLGKEQEMACFGDYISHKWSQVYRDTHE